MLAIWISTYTHNNKGTYSQGSQHAQTLPELPEPHPQDTIPPHRNTAATTTTKNATGNFVASKESGRNYGSQILTTNQPNFLYQKKQILHQKTLNNHKKNDSTIKIQIIA